MDAPLKSGILFKRTPFQSHVQHVRPVRDIQRRQGLLLEDLGGFAYPK
jgi:hypothetical protein